MFSNELIRALMQEREREIESLLRARAVIGRRPTRRTPRRPRPGTDTSG